ncbi:MAG: nucleotidyl transferase AbiEii/AbiGii toxin family protein, partial [Candidatus Omnitrophica bacterium]|nr:nucleotidyl transferase AbiEii/AbiGii toxin family protein [Candidatus Omnitrophota bacterium]
LGEALRKKVSVKAQNLEDNAVKMVIYDIHFTATDALKIDFVEDAIDLLKKTKTVDGINILSLEDIYLRKLYALAGMIKTLDDVGQNRFIGGRTAAKDFYDVYFLSHTFMPLSKFVSKYCNLTMKEAIVKWFQTYDRMTMMDGVLTLETNKVIDCKTMEKHFKKEVGSIIDHELGGI